MVFSSSSVNFGASLPCLFKYSSVYRLLILKRLGCSTQFNSSKNLSDVRCSSAERRDDVDRRCSSRSRCAEKRGERLHAVPCLNVLDVLDIARVEELRAVEDERQLSPAANHP